MFRSFKQLFTIEKRWAIFSDRQKKKLKRLQCDWLKGHHRKLNRQNRNKMSEDRQRKLIANHQQFNKWIKQIIVDPNNTRRKQLMMIMSFSPFSFCWKFDYFQNKWRVARYKATIHDDKNYKKEEYDEYFAWGCISESNNYYLYMFMTSLRREPIRGHQNCSIATIWCRIKCVLTKNSLFKQFFPSKQFWVYCKFISVHCQS